MYQCLHEDHSSIPSHIVSRENPCCVCDRQSPPRSLWETVPPSSWRTQFRLADARCDIRISRCHPRLPPSLKQCVSSRLRANDHRATCAKSSVPSPRASGKPPVLLSSGQFDACDFVRQASEFENSLLARERSEGKRNIGLLRFYSECIISHVIQAIKLEVDAYRFLHF